MIEAALLKAIRYCGSKQKALADLIGEHPDKISYWLNRAKRIPFHSAIAIEKATEGIVSRYDLAPYARTQKKNAVLQTALEKNNPIQTISECVAIGMSCERSLGNRQGARHDLFESHSVNQKNQINTQRRSSIDAELRFTCTQVRGKKTDLAAKHAGFSSRSTYLRAKKVVAQGIFKVIEAMDTKQISIATAALLSEYTPEEQERLLSQNKLDRVAALNSKTSDKKSTKKISEDISHAGHLLQSHKLTAVEQQHQLPLRLVLLVLSIHSDSRGYFLWQWEKLKREWFCYVELEIPVVLDTLLSLGWIKKIKRAGQLFGQITKK